MLHISRKIGESIIIGNDITVKLLSVKGRTAKLGFESPKGIQIFRKELYERIKNERETNEKHTHSSKKG